MGEGEWNLRMSGSRGGPRWGASINGGAIGGFETGILTDVRGCQDGRGRPPGALLMDASHITGTLTALGAALRELPDPWGVDLRHTWASESPYAALVEDTHTAPSV